METGQGHRGPHGMEQSPQSIIASDLVVSQSGDGGHCSHHTLDNIQSLDPAPTRERLNRLPSNMKESLGPGFSQAVLDLVSWFMTTDGQFDEKTLKTVVEEVLSENGKMSDLELQTAVRRRYSQKIYAVLQVPAINLNPLGPRDSMPVRRYKFSALTGPSEIRLFKFKRFITLGAQIYISCEIVHANLDDNPAYVALSYVWGALDPCVPVLIGDKEFLMVTFNFMEVLFRISGADTPTDKGNTTQLFWSDQLCINQYDADERSAQVAMMRLIYSEADSTKLWLGEEDEVAKQAFSLIRCFESIDLDTPPDLLNFTGMDSNDIRGRFSAAFPHAVDSIPPKSDLRWKALFLFLDRPWFSRIWVFQEAILSSTRGMGSIICGQMACNFIHLYIARSLLFIDWDVTELPSGLQMVSQYMTFFFFWKYNSLPPISFTVWQIGGCLRSHDPRDRVFGLLGIQNPKDDIGFVADYAKPVQEVFIDFTRRCIEHDQSLRVLSFNKENAVRDIPNLPFWVPDWSVEAATTPFEGPDLTDSSSPRFNASGSLQYKTAATESGADLVVKGKIVDYVVATMEHDFRIGSPVRIEEYFAINFRVKLWVDFIELGIQRGLIAAGTRNQLQAAVIRTLIADKFNDSHQTKELSADTARLSDEAAGCVYDELERLKMLCLNGHPHDGSNMEMVRKLWTNTEVCKGRRLSVLHQHWIMLGPSLAREGDRICILHGSNVPWVLRPTLTKGHYELIGQCFMDGGMYGEAVDWAEDEADTFVLV
jgi:hypothetical protein